MGYEADEQGKKAFGRRLAAARQGAGMTQMDLSEALGYTTYSNVRRWERGEGLPGYEQIVALCRALGVTADHLLGLDGRLPYAEELEAAARGLGGTQDWAVWEPFQGAEGDDALFADLVQERTNAAAALYAALERSPTPASAWDLAHNEPVQRLAKEVPDLTVGEARFLAGAVRFHGGGQSPLRNSPRFYRWMLDRLRARMAGEPEPAAPAAVKRLLRAE